MSHLCDLFSRHKANTLAILISKVKISEEVGVGSVVAYNNWYSDREYVIYISYKKCLILLIFFKWEDKIAINLTKFKGSAIKNINTTTPKYEIKSTTNRHQLTTLNQNRGRGCEGKFLVKITLSRILLDMQLRTSL